MRYAWDLQHQCLREARLDHGVAGWIARYILFKMRLWDTRTAAGVDSYLANSHYVGRRIRKVYGRSCTVIHPPVDVPAELPPPASPTNMTNQNGFYLAASRLVPYKNIMAIVQAFAAMPGRRLVVAGTGPELQRLQAFGAPNVQFVGFVPDQELRYLMRAAKAFVFAAEEDFGIVPVEVQGEGTPVIALGRGGLLETVVTQGPFPTGMFFERAEAACIVDAVEAFERSRHLFSRAACHTNALQFSTARFEHELTDFVHGRYELFQRRLSASLASSAQQPFPMQSLWPATVEKSDFADAELAASEAYESSLSEEAA